MPTLHMLRVEIVKRHENGESYRMIGDSLGISKGTADRIAHGHKPGKVIAAVLKLEPPAKLLSTRRRNAQANEVARHMGYRNWSQLTTVMIDWYAQIKKG